MAYVAHDRPLAAEAILEGFLTRADLIAQFPEQGVTWADGLRPELRFIVYESYRIYRIDSDWFAPVNHGQGHTVFHASGWVQALHLHIHVCGAWRWEVLKTHEGRVANEVMHGRLR